MSYQYHKTGARGRYIPMGQGRALPLHLVAGARSEHVSSPRRDENLSKTFATFRVLTYARKIWRPYQESHPDLLVRSEL